MSSESWRIDGDYFESCNCELLCPCLLSSAQARPTEGHCDVVLGIRIAQGNYGAVDISGLNAVQAMMTPGAMAKGGGTLEASMVKAYACRAAEWVSREAMQIHGGMGYAEEFAVSRLFVDARVLSIFEGADETLALKVVARRLVERAAQR